MKITNIIKMPKKGVSNNPAGRTPGSVNKTTASVKAAILLVYDKIGGDAAFAKWARTNRDDYYNRIYTKLVPVDITSGENPIGQPQYFDVAKLPADTLLELITAMDRIKKLQPEKVNAE